MGKQHFNKITRGFTCSLTVSPRFHGQFRENDPREDISVLNQVDTVYHFDAPHIRIQKITDDWSEDSIRALRISDHAPAEVSPDEIFTPLETIFQPTIVYSRNRSFGKLHLAMQVPNPTLAELHKITVSINNPAKFSLVIVTGLISHRFLYGWDGHLVISF